VSEHTRYNVLEFVPKDFFLRSTIFKSHEIKKKHANNSSVYEVLKGKTIRSNIIERGGGGGRSLLLVWKIIPDFSVRPAAVWPLTSGLPVDRRREKVTATSTQTFTSSLGCDDEDARSFFYEGDYDSRLVGLKRDDLTADHILRVYDRSPAQKWSQGPLNFETCILSPVAKRRLREYDPMYFFSLDLYLQFERKVHRLNLQFQSVHEVILVTYGAHLKTNDKAGYASGGGATWWLTGPLTVSGLLVSRL